MALETVFAVWDYYDGIRTGVANLKGEPHYFEQEWSNQKQDHLPTFLLRPISIALLSKVIEQHQIFRDWESRFHRGLETATTHPGLPGQRNRFTELGEIIATDLKESRPGGHRALGCFNVKPSAESPPKGVMREFEVEWRDVD